MKRVAPIIFVILAVIMMSSCANSHKQCGAYAKHVDTTNTPAFDDVQ